MDRIIKRILQASFILIILVGIAYFSYKAYLHIVEDASRRIRKDIGETLNPLKWPGKLIGGGNR